MQSVHGMFLICIFFFFFFNIYNYLKQKKKNVTNRIDLQFASISKMLHK